MPQTPRKLRVRIPGKLSLNYHYMHITNDNPVIYIDDTKAITFIRSNQKRIIKLLNLWIWNKTASLRWQQELGLPKLSRHSQRGTIEQWLQRRLRSIKGTIKIMYHKKYKTALFPKTDYFPIFLTSTKTWWSAVTLVNTTADTDNATCHFLLLWNPLKILHIFYIHAL
jgi:hypothetical protein